MIDYLCPDRIALLSTENDKFQDEWESLVGPGGFGCAGFSCPLNTRMSSHVSSHQLEVGEHDWRIRNLVALFVLVVFCCGLWSQVGYAKLQLSPKLWFGFQEVCLWFGHFSQLPSFHNAAHSSQSHYAWSGSGCCSCAPASRRLPEKSWKIRRLYCILYDKMI